jgi:pimeloyl-ACP methyl ester carboxylesterase
VDGTTELAVHDWGAGPRVVLVHGGAAGSRETWWAQKPLSERWNLVAPDRIGHGDSPAGPNDFVVDAELIADQVLVAPSHVVGYSYGALSAMFVTARAPGLVRSLTLVEPPLPQVAEPSAEVDAWATEFAERVETLSDDLPALMTWFYRFIGVPLEVPDPLPEWLEKGAAAFKGARLPNGAELPLDEIRGLGTPVLVVSGGHHPVQEAICDGLAERLGARRETVAGLGHLVPSAGEPFNRVVEDFWLSTDR